jgi:hypothetical protein
MGNGEERLEDMRVRLPVRSAADFTLLLYPSGFSHDMMADIWAFEP